MDGANPLIQVQNTFGILQSAPYMHGLVHRHMHHHTPQHAFTPRLHQSSTNPAVLLTRMEAQGSKSYYDLPRGTVRSSFTPVTTFHRAMQKPFRTKQGRWGALHVSIAWKIYYHKLKKMLRNPNSHYGEPSSECPPALSLSDSVQHQQSEQPSCMHQKPDSLCGQPTHRNTGERSETAGKASDVSTSPPASCCGRETKREEVEHPLSLHCRVTPGEERGHKDPQTDTTQDLHLRKKSRDQTVTPEHGCRQTDGSPHRQRQLNCDGFVKVKRVKQEIVDEQFDSSNALHRDRSSFSAAHMHPSSCTVPHINLSGQLSVLYPDSSRCNITSAPAHGGFISYPGAEMHPYLSAPWQPVWFVHKSKDLHSRQSDYLLNTCKGMGIPLVAQRQKEAFRGSYMPPYYFPLALRKQEATYLRGRDFVHSRHENCHLQHCEQQLPHAGPLATSFMGP